MECVKNNCITSSEENLLIELNNEIDDDMAAARRLILGDYCDFDPWIYGTVYPTTNEHMHKYQHHFSNKKTMLSVIGSGEQIFNAILAGVEKIDAFDISRFVVYYFYLKKAGIYALSEDEFVYFFHTNIRNADSITASIKLQLYQEKIRQYLPKEISIFWDYLFSTFEWKRIMDRFFHITNDNLEDIIKNNHFLQDNNYLELRARLQDTQVDIKIGDFERLAISKAFVNECDLAYLSNIHTYCHEIRFEIALERISTSLNGIVIIALPSGDRCDVSQKFLRSLPYAFTREDGYLIGKRKNRR